ncbi:peptidoglycan DD-metalloendopeptidase family protein [bacterium]|nr:peptidoglycan DD-metalloendopeptidase family protein [bacterium]
MSSPASYKLIACALAATTLLSLEGVLGPDARAADPIKAHQDRLHEIHQRLEATRQRVKTLRRQEHKTVDQLSDLQQKLERTSVQLEDSEFRLDRAQKQLEATKVALGKAKTRFAREQVLARSRLRAIYKHRQADYWEALLTAPDLSTFTMRYQYFKHISQTDAELLHRLDNRLSDITVQRKRYGATVQTIATVTDNIKQQKEEIQDNTEQTTELLERIRSQRAEAEAAIAQLERDSQQIEAMIRRLMAARRRMPRLGTGRFARPVDSPIGSGFGMRYHPILHVNRPHRGLDFSAPSGTPIKAVDRGVVIWSGWFGAFGKLVIIDHGGDLTTLYAHTSRIVVSKGDPVERGQLIAYSGSTGLSTGPHLHFEVRRNGTPVDPLGFLR